MSVRVPGPMVLIPLFGFFFFVFPEGASPKLQLYSLSGDLHRSSEIYQGLENHQKVVYSFWSFSCLPCMAEFPHLLQLQKEKKSVKFYFVNVLDEREKISEFAEKNSIDKTSILLDERLAGARSFRVLNKNQQPILPQLFVLNNIGNIIFKLSGYTEANITRLKTILTIN